MDADQLRDLARRAANRTGYRQILVLGSQAIHGALPDVVLPPITTISEEADLAVDLDLLHRRIDRLPDTVADTLRTGAHTIIDGLL